MPRYRAEGGRVAYFDNAKILLMASVVVGHLLKAGGAPHKRYARALTLFIYAFHMPLFIFVSGLFLNRNKMEGKRVAKHAATFFAWGMVAKLFRAITPWLLGKAFHFSLLSESGLPWFMFALSAYYVLAWVLRRADGLTVLGISVALALVAGYVKPIGDVLCLSRIICFFPFFWLGHLAQPARIRSVLCQRETRYVCLAITFACTLACVMCTKQLYPLKKLFMGRYCYAKTGIEGCSWVHRLATYGISSVLGASVLALTPQRRMGYLTDAGTRTIQVYLLHYEVIDVLRNFRITRMLVKSGSWGWLWLIPLGIAITLALSVDVKALWRKCARRENVQQASQS